MELPLVIELPVILFPKIHPEELKMYIHTKTCTQVFIIALFTIAKNQKQTICPSPWDG